MTDFPDMVDEELIVSYAKIKRFVQDKNIRFKTVREFYKEKGIFIFSSVSSTLEEECPYFILNYSSADLLNAYSGKKVYPSVSGLFLTFDEEKTLDEVMQIVENYDTRQAEQEKIRLTDFQKKDDTIFAKIRYEYSGRGKFLFPDDNTVARDIRISKTNDAKKFLVTCEVNSREDCSKTLNFFTFDYFKDHFKVVHFMFSSIQETRLRHELINNAFNEIKRIELEIDGQSSEFNCLGIFDHNAAAAGDITLSGQPSYLKSSNRLVVGHDIKLLPDLVTELESQAGAYLKIFSALYWSETQRQYLLIKLQFDRYYIITYNSLRLCDPLVEFDPSKLNHPKTRGDYNELHRTVVPEAEIKDVLEKLWSESAIVLSEGFRID